MDGNFERTLQTWLERGHTNSEVGAAVLKVSPRDGADDDGRIDCYALGMSEEQPDAPEPLESPAVPSTDPAPPGDGGAKLFVIFFLTLVPLIGMALVALVIYSLLVR